jgi:hypothetical protein
VGRSKASEVSLMFDIAVTSLKCCSCRKCLQGECLDK